MGWQCDRGSEVAASGFSSLSRRASDPKEGVGAPCFEMLSEGLWHRATQLSDATRDLNSREGPEGVADIALDCDIVPGTP